MGFGVKTNYDNWGVLLSNSMFNTDIDTPIIMGSNQVLVLNNNGDGDANYVDVGDVIHSFFKYETVNYVDVRDVVDSFFR